MNILFLSTENPIPADHGHHIRTYHVVKHLAEKHRIFFLAFAKSEKELAYASELRALCQTVDIIPLPEMAQPWRLYTRALRSLTLRDPFVVTRYVSALAHQRIQEILAEQSIELVHFDMTHLAGYLDDVRHLPKILVHHNVESVRVARRAVVERNLAMKAFLYSQALKLWALEQRVCVEFDRCITVSDVDRSQLVKLCQYDNFTVVPNGVDTDYFQPAPYGSIRKGGLVWTGGMNSPYNSDAVDYFLKAIAPRILVTMPDLRMVFVGKDPTALLRKTAQEHNNIIVAGYVDDVRPLVDDADVFIAPIRSGSGTKLKILNAMAQAKAVVTTPVGVEGIDAEGGKNILIAKDEVEFAAMVLELMKDTERAEEMGRNARQLVERLYEWRIIAEDMCRIYDEVANDRNRLKGVSNGIQACEVSY